MADGEVRAQDLAQETASTLSGNEQFVMFDSTAGKRADIDDVAKYIAGDKSTLKTTDKTSPVAAINENFDAIADVKEDLKGTVQGLTNYNVNYISPTWEQGGLNTSGEFVHNKLIRTGFIEITNIRKIYTTIPADTLYAIYFYNSAQTYISRILDSTAKVNETDSAATYMRIVFSTNPITVITPTFGGKMTVSLEGVGADDGYDLYPTNTTADRGPEITQILAKKKKCRLAKGDYYVKVLVMQTNEELIGCGQITRIIRHPDTTYNYLIRMGTRCKIHDLSIVGSLTDITVTNVWNFVDDPPGRCAIRIQGTGSDSSQRYMVDINDVFISGFEGSGVFVYHTGYDPQGGSNITNVIVRNCNAGIALGRYAEYHRITGCRAYECYYGCVNNGGNNVFENCDFSTNVQGLLMDNSSGAFTNNSHGAFIGCSFNHNGNNTGVGIELVQMGAGEMFVGCNIFYGSILLTGSQGIVLNACNFGSSTPITITNGGGVLFSNCMFRTGQSPTTIIGNTGTHFVNCYYLNGDIINNTPS